MAAPAPTSAATREAPTAPNPAVEAFALGLYERHARRVFAFCLSRLRRREDAEDATQTTFLHAHRALAQGVRPRSETAWLLKIAHNVCLNEWNARGRRRRLEVACAPESLERLGSASGAGRDHLVALREALAGLSEAQRQAILLREWRGLSYAEIADELGLSQAAVETLIFRARRALAANLAEEQEGGRRRLRALDLGSLLAAVKSAFAGGLGTKAAALAGAVVAGVVVGAGVGAPEPPSQAPPAPTPAASAPTPPGHARDTASTALLEAVDLHAAGAVPGRASRARTARAGSPSSNAEEGAGETPPPAAELLEEASGTVVGALEGAAGEVLPPTAELLEEETGPVVGVLEEATTAVVPTAAGAVETLAEPANSALESAPVSAGDLDTPLPVDPPLGELVP